MKNQALKTISILSLFVVLSISASNVSAFPTCPNCRPQYVASQSIVPEGPPVAPAAGLVTKPNALSTTSQPERSVDGLAGLWPQLVMFFASLF